MISDIAAFAKTHMVLLYYLLGINLITFIAFARDKAKAVHHQWRTRESVLMGLSFIGGTIGGLIAMYTLRHKTKTPKFCIGLPVMLAVQIILLAYCVMNY